MKIIDSLQLTLKHRREQKRNSAATERVQAEQALRYRFMNELEVAGYQIVKTSKP